MTESHANEKSKAQPHEESNVHISTLHERMRECNHEIVNQTAALQELSANRITLQSTLTSAYTSLQEPIAVVTSVLHLASVALTSLSANKTAAVSDPRKQNHAWIKAGLRKALTFAVVVGLIPLATAAQNKADADMDLLHAAAVAARVRVTGLSEPSVCFSGPVGWQGEASVAVAWGVLQCYTHTLIASVIDDDGSGVTDLNELTVADQAAAALFACDCVSHGGQRYLDAVDTVTFPHFNKQRTQSSEIEQKAPALWALTLASLGSALLRLLVQEEANSAATTAMAAALHAESSDEKYDGNTETENKSNIVSVHQQREAREAQRRLLRDREKRGLTSIAALTAAFHTNYRRVVSEIMNYSYAAAPPPLMLLTVKEPPAQQSSHNTKRARTARDREEEDTDVENESQKQEVIVGIGRRGAGTGVSDPESSLLTTITQEALATATTIAGRAETLRAIDKHKSRSARALSGVSGATPTAAPAGLRLHTVLLCGGDVDAEVKIEASALEHGGLLTVGDGFMRGIANRGIGTGAATVGGAASEIESALWGYASIILTQQGLPGCPAVVFAVPPEQSLRGQSKEGCFDNDSSVNAVYIPYSVFSSLASLVRARLLLADASTDAARNAACAVRGWLPIAAAAPAGWRALEADVAESGEVVQKLSRTSLSAWGAAGEAAALAEDAAHDAFTARTSSGSASVTAESEWQALAEESNDMYALSRGQFALAALWLSSLLPHLTPQEVAATAPTPVQTIVSDPTVAAISQTADMDIASERDSELLRLVTVTGELYPHWWPVAAPLFLLTASSLCAQPSVANSRTLAQDDPATTAARSGTVLTHRGLTFRAVPEVSAGVGGCVTVAAAVARIATAIGHCEETARRLGRLRRAARPGAGIKLVKDPAAVAAEAAAEAEAARFEAATSSKSIGGGGIVMADGDIVSATIDVDGVAAGADAGTDWAQLTSEPVTVSRVPVADNNDTGVAGHGPQRDKSMFALTTRPRPGNGGTNAVDADAVSVVRTTAGDPGPSPHPALNRVSDSDRIHNNSNSAANAMVDDDDSAESDADDGDDAKAVAEADAVAAAVAAAARAESAPGRRSVAMLRTALTVLEAVQADWSPQLVTGSTARLAAGAGARETRTRSKSKAKARWVVTPGCDADLCLCAAVAVRGARSATADAWERDLAAATTAALAGSCDDDGASTEGARRAATAAVAAARTWGEKEVAGTARATHAMRGVVGTSPLMNLHQDVLGGMDLITQLLRGGSGGGSD